MMTINSSALARVSLLTACLAFVACKKPEAGAAAPPASSSGPTLIGAESAYKVEQQRITSGPRISGSLEAKKQAVIRAEVAGSVVEVRAELGEAVKQGQLLARVEDQALRDAYSSALSGVKAMEQDALLAQKQLERTNKLLEAGALAPRDQEMAASGAVSSSARLDQARAQLAAAKKQLDGATLQAPFDGVVSQRSVNTGDVVAPGAPMFSVIDPSSMRLAASVPTDEVGALTLGTDVTFEVRGYPGQTFLGKLERIAPAADPATRQIQVLVSIPNPGGRLIAGLFAEGRVATVSRDALVVPYSALDSAEEKARVVRVRDGKAEQVEVTAGLRDDRTERVEIVSGLQAGDVVLTGAARTVAPGTAIQIASTEGSKSAVVR